MYVQQWLLWLPLWRTECREGGWAQERPGRRPGGQRAGGSGEASSRFARNCVRRERKAHGGRGLPDVLHWGMSCCSTEMQETSEGRRLGRRPGSVVFLTLYILMCDTHTGECTDCDRTA